MTVTQYIVENGLAITLGIISGGLLCFILMSLFSPKIKRHQNLSKELTATKAELERQRTELVKHFSDSAELLDKMAQDFRHLYQHMANQSTSILKGDEVPPSLSFSEQKDEKDTANVALIDLSAAEQESPASPENTTESENQQAESHQEIKK